MKTQKQYKELTVREFTRAANRYETSRAGIYEMCREDYPYIEEELSKEEYTDLLNCGCGTGAMISILYEKDPSKHYTGLDITPAMIGAARNKNLSGVQWVVGDCENMPFEEAGFDVIICSNSFHHYPDPRPYDKFLSHEGVVARTIMLDRQMKSIIKKHPDTVVVNLGAGFDDRFSRVDNGRILWFDIDLADSIAARKKAFPERDRVTMVEADVLKEDWFGAIEEALKGRQSKPVFIAEGLFMYFTLEQIADLLRNIVRHFPDGGLMIAEQNCKLMAGNEKHHDAVKSTNARFLSGTDSAQEIADMVDGLQLVEEHSFNEEMKKYTLRGRLFAMLVPKMNNRWATFRWGGKTF